MKIIFQSVHRFFNTFDWFCSKTDSQMAFTGSTKKCPRLNNNIGFLQNFICYLLRGQTRCTDIGESINGGFRYVTGDMRHGIHSFYNHITTQLIFSNHLPYTIL